MVVAFASEVSGGLWKSLLERLEGFESFSTSVEDRCDSLRLCSMMPVCCSAVAMLACCFAIHVHCAFRSTCYPGFQETYGGFPRSARGARGQEVVVPGKDRYLVTPTFAPLERNRGSRAQTQKNSMVFVNFCPGPQP